MTTLSYTVMVYTGDLEGAGTDANVYLTIYGSKGELQETQLDSSDNNFERGKCDKFTFDLPDLGELQKVRIRQDNTRKHAGWYLDKIIISNDYGVSWTFPCYNWLSSDEGDRKIDRELQGTRS